MLVLPNGLQGLRQYKQFILWKGVLNARGSLDKLPLDPFTLDMCDAHSPQAWVDADTAYAQQEKLGAPYGVGFVFTRDDPYFFIDIDNCYGGGDEWSEMARETLGRFPGASCNVSSSGRGLHIIARGMAPADRKCKYRDQLELYTEGRFAALSGNATVGDCNTEHTGALCGLVNEYLAPNTVGGAPASWTVEPVPEWTGPEDDTALIERAKGTVSARAAFGATASFAQLWDGDGDALGAVYPDDHGARPYDCSKADAALAAHLAFWTGKNCERIRSLMQQSALRRGKWTDRPEYLERTILGSVGAQQSVYDVPRPDKSKMQRVDGAPRWLFPEQQIDYFTGCTYILSQDKILTPHGVLMDRSRFRVWYGGYQFYLDPTGTSKTTNAFEAFTESRALETAQADDTYFSPMDPPGHVREDHNGKRVNVFTPHYGERVDGDVKPFLEHVARLLPNEADREILLSYLAACVQMPGVKFQWGPLVQGMQGNGKTALYTALEYALGENYCFQLNPNDVSNKFNGWVENKLLICVEELRVAGRMELADTLKPLITNERVSLQRKGVDQYTGGNCANFLMFSNHKDAVLKMRDDRRYCVLFTAQQSLDDLYRDGMTDAYFYNFYVWLKGAGRAHVAHYLASRPVTVNVLGRAPVTSSTAEAQETSLGVAEQILTEAIELEQPGFTGDLVSGEAAAAVLQVANKRISPQALVGVLGNINYIRHPLLASSRGRIFIDNRNIRVYVKVGSAAASIGSKDELRKAILNDNE